MAFFAQLGAETEELVTAVTSISRENDPDRFRVLYEGTVRALRYHNYPPSNPFEVKHNLDGLEERFTIVGRDELAEALFKQRSTLAEHETKWTADILGFLLELSNSPIEKASLDELRQLGASRIVSVPPPLRWKDISREDGWVDEMEIWKNTVFSTSDDNDDNYDDEGGEDDANSDGTTPSSVDMKEVPLRTAWNLAVTNTRSKNQLNALLQAVRDSQCWRVQERQLPSITNDGRVVISELQLLREAIFMLRGLETTLFRTQCVSVNSYRLSGVSHGAYTPLAEVAAANGRRLLPLRRWTARDRRAETVPLFQVFVEAIRRRLDAFDRQLSKVQERFVDLTQDVIVSLVAVLEELRPSLSNLFALGAIVQQLEAERNPRAFRYLELLYDATAMAQLDGRLSLYKFLGTVFFECFQEYLRPIRLWMEGGRLVNGDKIFFVSGGTAQAAPNQIWLHQYKLLHTNSGVLHAPRFLRPAASAIFAAGKSIVVLRKLGKYDDQNRDVSCATLEPTLNQASVCPPGSELVPFSQLFADAFERWIQSKHYAASATLQRTLFDSCGLWASLETLQCIFLMSDGAKADAFATRLFYTLDANNSRWYDCYTLTEFAREAFGSRQNEYRLSVAVDEVTKANSTKSKHGFDRAATARRSLREGVARVRISYRLAWPVQIIIPAESMAGYQSMFTILLQIRRASSFLCRHRLLDDGRQEEEDNDNEDEEKDSEIRRNSGHSNLQWQQQQQCQRQWRQRRRRRLPKGDRALYFRLRAKLLWLCGTLQSYLVTLVIAPNIAKLQLELQRAVDVDDMIQLHAAFLEALLNESCLNSKLQPIQDCLLDLLDLAIRLEDARGVQAAHEAEQLQETWRLSVLSSPYQSSAAKKLAATVPAVGTAVLSPSAGGSTRRRLFASSREHTRREDEDQKKGDYDGQDVDICNEKGANDITRETIGPGNGRGYYKAHGPSYGEVLRTISAEFNDYLRFAVGGLRGVARASSNAMAAAKWGMLAEMLEAGVREHR